MNTIGERILLVRGKMKQYEFADILGINANTLRAYENNRAMPNHKILYDICVKFSVSTDWLILGEGPMYKGERSQPDDLKGQSERISHLEEKIATLEERLMESQAETIRAYKLATTRMQPESDILQKPDSIKVEHAPVKQIYSESRADEKL